MSDRTATDELTLPSVVIVGRPNVGKSTLFNRIVGEQVAIVEDQPGVTRDRKEVEADWLGRRFTLVDTGGWLPSGTSLDEKVSRQVEEAVRAADLVLFLVDASTGVTDDDESLATWLRRIKSPVLVVANKADNDRRETERWEFLALGLGDPIPVSALHGRRAGDLLDEVIALIPEVVSGTDGVEIDEDDDWVPPEIAPPRVAVVGRPNVGKSTLFNRLVGEDRSVVHDMPGTTRDAIDTLVETEDGPIVFVDTAGMRRKSRIDEPTEYYSLVRALEAIDRADAALLLIDASEGVTHQDQRLAERIDAAGTAIVIVLNKWDLLDAEQRAKVRAEVDEKLYFLSYAPALPISALTGRRFHQLLPALREAEAAYHQRVPTAALNRVLRDAQAAHPPPVERRHRPRILYATQGATDPPTFTLFATRALSPQYLRYLERKLREAFDLGPTPVKIRVRRRDA